MPKLSHEASILREERRSLAQLLRENGLTYRDIAVVLGLEVWNVQQLLKPYTPRERPNPPRNAEDTQLKERLIAISGYEMPGCDGSTIPTDDTAVAAAYRDARGSTPRSSDDRTWRDEEEAPLPWVPDAGYLKKLSIWAAYVRHAIAQRAANTPRKLVLNGRGRPIHPGHHTVVDWESRGDVK